MTNEELDRRFAALRSDKLRDFSAKLIPGAGDICGLRIPDVRKIAKEIARDDWREWLASAPETYMEHLMLQGFVIAGARMESEERMQLLHDFIPKINNWAVCDTVIGTLKIKPAEQEKWWLFAQGYLTSNRTYEVRFGLVLLLHAFVQEQYLPAIFEHARRIDCSEYYVSMALAWLLSVCCVKFSEQTINFLSNNQLDKATHNRTIQKCVDSFRISADDKARLKQLRRK